MPASKAPASRGPAAGGSRVETVLSAEVIGARIEALALEIAGADSDRLLIVALLSGSFVFAADLIRALSKAGVAPEVDFLALSSYRKSSSPSASINILRDMEMEARGRNVILIDDVLESGRTLAFAKDLISARSARRVRTCVLIEKSRPRAVEIAADFRGFLGLDEYVVGFGMDLAGRYRELPFVGRVVRS